MTQHAAALLDEAMKLSADERAKLAKALLRSLDGDAGAGEDDAWAVELARRVASADAGRSSSSDWAVVRDTARSRLRDRG